MFKCCHSQGLRGYADEQRASKGLWLCLLTTSHQLIAATLCTLTSVYEWFVWHLDVPGDVSKLDVISAKTCSQLLCSTPE